MTAISSDHVEFAVVDRLRELLVSSQHKYNVSHRYAMLVAILCWTAQRIRKPDGSLSSIRDEIRSSDISKMPWSINIASSISNSLGATPESTLLVFQGRKEIDPWSFIVALRNAVAHGDARNVRPYHLPERGANHKLIGFTLSCGEEMRDGTVVWKGMITLVESDLVRIGSALAEMFRDKLKQTSGQSHLAEEADRHVIESAA